MRFSAALFALFALPIFVTSIPLDSVNDDHVNVKIELNERNIDKRQLSDDMFAIVNAISVYADEYNHYRGYSRSDFTQNIVQALYKFNPHFNYIICHSDHYYNFGNPWGVNVYHVWVTYDHHTAFTNNPGFDIVIGKNGTFTNNGDGGYENWAYIGDVIKKQESSSQVVVTFGMPA